MVGSDPLMRLNLDCALHILSYLHLDDVVRCERVSTYWRDIARSWMGKTGDSLPWTLPSSGDKCKVAAIKRFRYGAEWEANLRRGRASSVRRFNSAVSFYRAQQGCIAASGDFIACDSDEGLVWQSLSLNDDGSILPPKAVEVPGFSFGTELHHDQVSHLQLNDDGCLLFRARTHRSNSPAVRDRVICLKSGEELWKQDIDHPDWSSQPDLVPLLIGKERVYYTRTSEPTHYLLAYEFRTGKLAYEVPTDCSLSKNDPNQLVELIRDKGEEFIVNLSQRTSPCDLTIYDGGSGCAIEKCEYQGLCRFTLTTVPNTGTFTLMADVSKSRFKILLRFSRQSKDSFLCVGREGLSWERGHSKDDEFAVDPSTLFMVSFQQKRPIPKVWKLVECTDPELRDIVNEALLEGGASDIRVNWCWKPTEPQEIDLPPGPKGKKRRQFQVPSGSLGSNPWFLDRRHIAIHMHTNEMRMSGREMRHSAYKGIYLFDFTPRKRRA
ncbi:F-box protein [Aspergillus tanneri]|uniref:F-box domain-containing protein n=1 Tax=Aspergillus tanneri TaxID=1220188 RepID=A0A5M9MHF2_9EURO|nr:uncharacterized protein ATNIH1004_006655 [Aspergillus tanneri]KAA8645236.1 hypothetical protein ATNIH1004_006655 [Aspergillus tanneri]